VIKQKNQVLLKTYRITITADDNSEPPAYIVASAASKRDALHKALELVARRCTGPCPHAAPRDRGRKKKHPANKRSFSAEDVFGDKIGGDCRPHLWGRPILRDIF
jgi:hypothetical protein